jgi:hypothetical protein
MINTHFIIALNSCCTQPTSVFHIGVVPMSHDVDISQAKCNFSRQLHNNSNNNSICLKAADISKRQCIQLLVCCFCNGYTTHEEHLAGQHMGPCNGQ